MARKKKRSYLLRSLFKIFFWLAVASIAVFYSVRFFIKPPNIFYPGFRIEIPDGYKIHGIDVSRYQENINWAEVRKMEVRGIKIGFAFVKATEGIDKIDPQFRRNWLKSGEQDIPRGAYHFFIASRNGKKQARNFIEIVNLKKGDLPPAVDIEKTNGVSIQVIRKELADWLKIVEAHYGMRPIIYTNIDFYKNYLEQDFSEYSVWIAHYLQPHRPRLERKWILWQHSESGRVNGIVAPVDFNVFAGDSLEFRRFLMR